jgi:murein DD-endopeptidase MepM/ murein hydrolase activator NlpD
MLEHDATRYPPSALREELPMRRRSPLLLGLLLLVPATAWPQQAPHETRPVEDIRRSTPGVHALTNARIVVEPGRVLEGATLVIRDGRIEAVGTDVRAPGDARAWDMSGRTLYPGFIDAHAHLGLDEAPENGDERSVHWNPQLRAHFSAGEAYAPEDERLEGLRGQGFTVAHAVPRLGIFRGQTALVSLGNGSTREQLLRDGVAQSVSFSRDTELGETYPNSPMGAIAFIRQGLLDGDWYPRARAAYEADPEGLSRPETNPALAALEPGVRGRQPFLFETRMEEERRQAEALAEKATGLQELIASLETEITALRKVLEARRQASDENLMSETLPFARRAGLLPLPVSGSFARRFGEEDGIGGSLKGDILRTQSGVIVTAPVDGTVLYAGRFRSYGQLLILNPGDGYHIVLAGMDRLNVSLGQSVLAGEPVGVMGDTRLASIAASALDRAVPELYVEFRKDGKPIDPKLWWARELSGRTGNDT